MRAFTRAGLAITTIGVALAVGTAPAVARTAGVSAGGGASVTSVADCTFYLQARNYVIGDGVRTSCRNAADGSWYGYALCLAGLVGLGVQREHANAACVVAAA